MLVSTCLARWEGSGPSKGPRLRAVDEPARWDGYADSPANMIVVIPTKMIVVLRGARR